jgi:hypothetical protein
MESVSIGINLLMVKNNYGLGLGSATDIVVGGKVVASTLGVALMATPVGWVLVIGVGITAGYFAAKAFDGLGQWTAGKAYDTSKSVSWTSF